MTSSIVFLSDLGIRDEMVGVCHAVMARIAPDARIIDIGHGVPPLDIQAGALALHQALPYLASDAVVLAVVDPGSGTDRLALALRTTAGRLLVGPDNGLLSLAWAADDGLVEAVAITSPDVILHPPSPVLNARDVFSPAAARLASGAALTDLGPPVDPFALVTIRLTDPEIETHKISGEVIDIDRFGNVRLNVRSGPPGRRGIPSGRTPRDRVDGRRGTPAVDPDVRRGDPRRVRRPRGCVGLDLRDPLRRQCRRSARRAGRRPGLAGLGRLTRRAARATRPPSEHRHPSHQRRHPSASGRGRLPLSGGVGSNRGWVHTPTSTPHPKGTPPMALARVPAHDPGSPPDVAAFTAGLAGTVIRPEDEAYDAARQVHNARIDRRPGAHRPGRQRRRRGAHRGLRPRCRAGARGPRRRPQPGRPQQHRRRASCSTWVR